jgi:hypothetical protein
MSEITRRPSWFGTTLAMVMGLVSVLGTLFVVPVAAIASLAGVLVIGGGLAVASRRVVTIGGSLLVGGVLYAGYLGAPPEPLLFGALLGVLAWDVASNAISIGNQLGRETRTRRAETVHAAGSLVVGAFSVVLGYGVYLAAGGGQPLVALLFLVIGAVALVSGFR